MRLSLLRSPLSTPLAALVLSAAQLLFALPATHAQDAGVPADAAARLDPEAASSSAETGDEPSAEPEPSKPAEEPSVGPVLEPPSLTPLELDADAAAPAPETQLKAAPAAPEKKGWTAPETVFHLHGYLRMRGTLLKDGDLGRNPLADRPRLYSSGGVAVAHANYDPFAYFSSYDAKPIDSTTEEPGGTKEPVADGCGDNAGSGDGHCKKTTQVGADLRLRLKPEVHISDDIRVKAWIDLLDNVGLGTLGYGTNYQPEELDLGSAIKVRRAWGEARNRDIGEIRFGRMGADWGLGILDNGGDRNGIDSDFSSDLDRIMGMTNLAGFYFMTAYDWASQGKLMPGSASPSGVPIDRAQRDDYSAVTGAVAHKLDSEVQRSKLLRGEAVFNYGLYFIWRKQLLKNRTGSSTDEPPFLRVNQKQYIPDLWAQFLWEGLRVELEAAYVAGEMEGGCPRLVGATGPTDSVREAEESAGADGGDCKFRQLGVALEAEYRLFDDRLGIHFLSGLATGDKQSYGLAQTNDPSFQRVSDSGDIGDRTLSTYQFHPDYRVDLILWRTLMRRVAGAYYFKPGLSYDFIHDPYGQQAGARVDAVYSRAMAGRQTWGQDPNLGLELDISLYYRSEDGPDLFDGFYTTIQWGILFPFQGLEYVSGYPNGAGNSSSAMILRGVMGIAF